MFHCLLLFMFFFTRVLVKLQKEVISAEAALEDLRLSKHNLLLACKIEGLPLKLLAGSLDDISDIEVRYFPKMKL